MGEEEREAPPAEEEEDHTLPPSQTIYCSNISFQVKRVEILKSLRRIFTQFGEILQIHVPKSFHLKGRAWVTFSDIQKECLNH